MSNPRVFIAALSTETNSFAPFPTGWSGFAEYGIDRDGSSSDPNGPLSVFKRMSEEAGYKVIESYSSSAQPSGRTVASVYEKLRDMILDDLKDAGEIDMVLLFLHGAMMAEGFDDCEGDLLQRVREIVPDAVVGAVLDLHCHLTPQMVSSSDCLIAVKEYPHIDFAERAQELFEICDRARLGKVNLTSALVDTGMIGIYPTFAGPMRSITDALFEIEKQDQIVSTTLGHGFPWGDTADTGTRALVYTDGDEDLAQKTAQSIAQRMIDERSELLPDYPDIATSLDKVETLEGPIVLADHADNPGGGSPGDSTFFLEAVIQRGLKDVAIGSFHDPSVAQIAADAGVGARLTVRLGGKAGPASGNPLDLEVEVKAVKVDHAQSALGTPFPMGLSVWLQCQGVDVVVCSIRSQVFSLELFEDLGIRLADRHLVIVKSSSHFEAAYGPIAKHLWKVDTPGALGLDFAKIDYQVRPKDFFPLVDRPPVPKLIAV